MDNDSLTLYYANEDDRAYGLAGMAISLAALDAIDRVSSVTIDTENEMVTFSHYYYYSGSQSVSPKATWNHLLNNFYLTSAMALGNIKARSAVRLGQNDVPSELISRIKDEITAEGKETCSLEEDEIEAIFAKTLNLTNRIFGNRRLYPAIAEFARHISRRRTLSGLELAEELQMLGF